MFISYYPSCLQNDETERSHNLSFVSRGNDYVSRGNDYVSRGNDYVSRGNDYASRGNDYVSRGNDYVSRGNDYVSRGNDYLSVVSFFVNLSSYRRYHHQFSTPYCVVGVQISAKRAAWEDPVEWIVSTCPWKEFDITALQRIRPEDVGCDNTAAVTSSGNTFVRSGSVEPSDPLVNSHIQFPRTVCFK